MRACRRLLFGVLLLTFAVPCAAADRADLQALLDREIIGPRQALLEIQEYVDLKVPRLPEVKSLDEWEARAKRLREAVLERVVFRGEAAAWRDAKCRVEWQETIAGGPGYRIKKLRYEALPGLWIPALLYEPEKLSGKVPVILDVNGHDGNGKAAKYKQIRCINQAKRGMLALNVEWLGMGQLRGDGFHHGRMNQLDLCGTSGIAPFYLAMKRGLDILLALENADPERVAVTGLSGGGWQTIFISSLDTRVKLTNPVAGYSSFRTRIQHFKDLGDSEQTPCDLGTVADYTHLTALMAPRPTLLTYNSKDDCCFESGYALPPLLDAAGPIFKLFGKELALRSHVNDDPGTHNYEKDNRQAHYRMLGDHFYAGDASFKAEEMPSDDEVKKKEELAVDLPTPNADFHTLAMELSRSLPRDGELPTDKKAALKWQQAARERLHTVLHTDSYKVNPKRTHTEERAGVRASYWKLHMADAVTDPMVEVWTIPVVELERGEAKGTTLLLADGGRRSAVAQVERLLDAGQRVLALDPFYFGEARVMERDWLFALLLATVGDRALGVQAHQVAAVARWARAESPTGPLSVVAVGPRSSTIALVAAGLEEKAIARLDLSAALGSLKEVIEENRTVQQTPELFCFGLLEAFDVKQLAALVAPRPVQFLEPGPRVKKEMAGLKAWYETLGSDFQPLP
jgi:hypothetical protein